LAPRADAVYDAVFRRAGMLRVYSLDELFDAVEILAMAVAPKGPPRVAISNGGGVAVLATDHLIDEGGILAELAPETRRVCSNNFGPPHPAQALEEGCSGPVRPRGKGSPHAATSERDRGEASGHRGC
jgi:acyl-CoA synthetase (NDP forming)